MSDPLVNESMLVTMVDCVCEPDNTAKLQAGAVMSIINGFDRKLTRESFVDLVLAAIALHTQSGKLYLLHNMKEAYEAPDDGVYTFRSALRDTYAAIHDTASSAQKDVRALLKLITSCPTSDDTVN